MCTQKHLSVPESTFTPRKRSDTPSNRGRGDLSSADVIVRFTPAADIVSDDELDLLESIMPELIRAMIALENDTTEQDLLPDISSSKSPVCGTHQQTDNVVYEATES